jgi:TM2 domain-containing membrane protein YozV
MVVCPECGKDVPEAKFCKNCGAYIADVNVIESQADAPVEVEEDDSIPVTIKSDEDSVEGEVSDEVEEDDSVPVAIKSDVEDGAQEEVLAEDIPVSNDSTREVKYCFNCGHEIGGNLKFCPQCGQDLSGKVANRNASPNQKSTLLAVILSVLLPGLGQIYLGLDHKGAIFLIAYIISAILILLLIGFILCPVLWIWALVDTIMSANAINKGEEVNDKLL